MKRKLKVIVTSAVALAIGIALYVRAGLVTFVGNGVTMGANSISNFATTAQIGTFSLNPQFLYLTSSTMTNTNLFTVTGQLSFDGTNKFPLPQVFVWATTNGGTNFLWQVTNISIPVYGTISVSNGNGQNVSNFQAALTF